jgi:hypothetical protein
MAVPVGRVVEGWEFQEVMGEVGRSCKEKGVDARRFPGAKSPFQMVRTDAIPTMATRVHYAGRGNGLKRVARHVQVLIGPPHPSGLYHRGDRRSDRRPPWLLPAGGGERDCIWALVDVDSGWRVGATRCSRSQPPHSV